MTNSNGRATFTYTAPSFVAGAIPSLQLSVTPTGNRTTRPRTSAESSPFGSCRPASLPARRPRGFTFLPANRGGLHGCALRRVDVDGRPWRRDHQLCLGFRRWHERHRHHGRRIDTPRLERISTRLTVTDSNGFSNQSEAQTVTVGAARKIRPQPGSCSRRTSPTASETPGLLQRHDVVYATDAGGTRIVSYRWNWGDGNAGAAVGSTAHRTRFDVSPDAGCWCVARPSPDEVGQMDRVDARVARRRRAIPKLTVQ